MINDCSKVKISLGNRKMGAIPSVSLLPIVTCKHCEACKEKCYAKKMLRYANVKKSYSINTEMACVYKNEYFAQIANFCKLHSFFRWHVSGDIIDYEYFNFMVLTAKATKNCEHLVFTKNYEDVNEWISKHKEGIPKNLHVIFSDFYEFHCDNPFNLPKTNVIKTIDDLPKNAKLCSGNCTECICRNMGCWNLKKGETLYFIEH